jgi:hypothetical protein
MGREEHAGPFPNFRRRAERLAAGILRALTARLSSSLQQQHRSSGMGTNSPQPVDSGNVTGAVDDFQKRAEEAQLASIRMSAIQLETSSITAAAKARGDLAAQIGSDLRQSAKVKE